MIETNYIVAEVAKLCGVLTAYQSVVNTSESDLENIVDEIVVKLNNVCLEFARFRTTEQTFNINVANFVPQQNSMYAACSTITADNTNGIAEITSLMPTIGSAVQCTPLRLIPLNDFYAAAKVSVTGSVPSIWSFDPATRSILCAPPLAQNIYSGLICRGVPSLPIITYQYTPTITRAQRDKETVEIIEKAFGQKEADISKKEREEYLQIFRNNDNLKAAEIMKIKQRFGEEYAKLNQERKALKLIHSTSEGVKITPLPFYTFTPSQLDFTFQPQLANLIILETASKVAPYLKVKIDDDSLTQLSNYKGNLIAFANQRSIARDIAAKNGAQNQSSLQNEFSQWGAPISFAKYIFGGK